MYRTEVMKMENAVEAALRTSDFNEMMYRLQRAGEEQADEGFTGDIAVGAVFRRSLPYPLFIPPSLGDSSPRILF